MIESLLQLPILNPALPNIHDILRKKQPILQSTEHLLAEILAYNKSALCRSASPTLSFVLPI